MLLFSVSLKFDVACAGVMTERGGMRARCMDIDHLNTMVSSSSTMVRPKGMLA